MVDLRTSKVPSVVTLRDEIKIPPPSTLVLVKTFKRGQPARCDQARVREPGCGRCHHIRQVCRHPRYPLQERIRDDVLCHELVHAYITMASPKPLPFWFQEGSAVIFPPTRSKSSTEDLPPGKVGVLVGHTVEVADSYKQKLESFHYMIEKAGKKRFYKWYRNTVLRPATWTRERCWGCRQTVTKTR